MVKENLQFFDKDGYNLNFDWNQSSNCWEGTIYLPKVSVGLYANTSIYVLEEVNGNFAFPMSDGQGDQIRFTWDKANKFVDEFFMFNFDNTYIIKDTSALVYMPNDGPECETLIINRFDEYVIDLDDMEDVSQDFINAVNDQTGGTSIQGYGSRALPIHVAFMANERYDATTYTRTLIMYHGKDIVARIRFFEETVEEDERLKIWNSNLGYNITPEDTMIFYRSDIKEYKPDYLLLNEKRKELMMEGSNIYPYIGSYRAIINAIKFFGYDNLGIIEYWKNVNPNDENFGKLYHSSRYSLTKKETLNIGARKITLPNKDFKKVNKLALVYSINQPTGKVDIWELPLVKEKFTYTIEEALIKLFALRKKLNKEFMPCTSKIIDIIGEANYFGLQGITKTNADWKLKIFENEIPMEFDSKFGRYVHITDDRYFSKYIREKKLIDATDEDVTLIDIVNYYSNTDVIKQFNTISDISNIAWDDESLKNQNVAKYRVGAYPENDELCQLYTDYYNAVFVDHTKKEEPVYYDTDDLDAPVSAKVVLECDPMEMQTFFNSELSFDYDGSYCVEEPDPDNPGEYRFVRHFLPELLTFDTVDDFGYNTISWDITMSDNQFDEDLKEIGVGKEYEKKTFSTSLTGSLSEFGRVFLMLPYIGYYDVTMTINETHKKTKRKFIKVEPYNIEMLGFYYDARELPEHIKYDIPEGSEIYEYIHDKVKQVLNWAVTERTAIDNPVDFTVPTYTVKGEFINKGPYVTGNLSAPWYLLDNINYDIPLIEANVKYARYIESGVDVKPYTWFVLTYNFGKIAGKCKPKWTIRNNVSKEEMVYEGLEEYLYSELSENYKARGRYLTCILKEEGNYTIKLELEDTKGNKYEISRNIFVVDNNANHNLYQPFKKKYDDLMEQERLAELRRLETFSLDEELEIS